MEVSMLKALIFDMDGVIVDTEYIDFQLQSDYIHSISKNPERLQKKDFSDLVGRSGMDLIQSIQHLSQTNVSVSEIKQSLEAIDQKKYAPATIASIFRSDLMEILNWAKENNIKLAVASSSPKNRIEQVLETCQIKNYFDYITSGQDFKMSKPDPEIYLTSAQHLEVQPYEAIAIEDSPAGIASAKFAGMTVIAYQEDRLGINQSQADYCEKDMQAILKRLKELAKGQAR